MSSPLVVNFPTSLDDLTSLGRANNRAFATLATGVDTDDLSFVLTDSTVFPSDGALTIVDDLTSPTKVEEVTFTANAANTLTIGTRGAFGSTAQNWSSGAYVRQRYLAEHHEAIRDALIATQTKIGYGSATPTNGKFLVGNTTAGTSQWRILATGDIPDLSATYEPANANIQAHIASTSNPHSVTKSQVGLGNVENTALSTWAGSTSITTLGTIATGTWNGSVIGSSYGGAGTVNGILKANGSGVVSAAVAGTDYLSATAPGSSGNLIYNNGGAYAALASSTVSGSNLTIDGSLYIGDGSYFGFYPEEMAAFDRVFSGTIDDNSFLAGLEVSQSLAPGSVTASVPSGYGIDCTLSVANTDSTNWHSLNQFSGLMEHLGSGTVGDAYGYIGQVYLGGSGNITRAYGLSAYMQNYGSGTIANLYGMYPQHAPQTGAVTNAYAYYANAEWKHATVTNAYFAWFDSSGVWRVNGDGIVAYYNPAFTKYTPGATNYERIVTQWNSNVAEIGTEASGTGTSRALRLIGASYKLAALTSNGFVKTSGSDGSLSVDTTTYIASGGALGTPSSGTLTNCTGLPPTTGIVGWPANASGVLTNNGSGTLSWAAASSGATTALDNLASVSINASLIPQTTLNLGAQAAPWKNLWLYGGGTFGTHSIKLDGTPTGHRTITFPDATDTVAVLGTAQTFSAAQSFSNTITQTSNSATAFQSGPNGGTNPVFRLVNSTASAATGISITGAAAGGGVAIATLSSGTNEQLNISAKGSGNIVFTFGSGTQFTMSSSQTQVGTVFFANGFRAANGTQYTWSDGTDFNAGIARVAGSATARFTNGSTGSGNILLGTSTVGAIGTSGVGVLAIANGTAPGSSPVDTAQFYSADWNGAGTAAAHFRNEEGHIVKICSQAVAALTNNVTSGGTTDQITDWTIVDYATDAAAIRNAIYQLSRKLAEVVTAQRSNGLFR